MTGAASNHSDVPEARQRYPGSRGRCGTGSRSSPGSGPGQTGMTDWGHEEEEEEMDGALPPHPTGMVSASRPPTRSGSALIARPVRSSVTTKMPQTVASPSAASRRGVGSLVVKRRTG